MSAVVLAATAGLLICAGLWATGGDMFRVGPLERTNYRGEPIATGVGILIPVTTMIVVAAGHLALLSTGRGPVWYAQGRTTALAAAGFGLLGLLDDVAGAGQSGGFRRHLRALWHGRLTSAAVKLIAGGALGVLVAAAAPSSDPSLLAGLRDGAVVALAANLANLFDRAPGRCIKFTAAAFAVAAVVARRSELAGPAVGVGAGLALLGPDLREKAMLGDAGANPLGALVGLGWLLAVPSPQGRWLLLAAMVLANVGSEFVSYSAVIDRVGPLRWVDRLGSLRA